MIDEPRDTRTLIQRVLRDGLVTVVSLAVLFWFFWLRHPHPAKPVPNGTATAYESCRDKVLKAGETTLVETICGRFRETEPQKSPNPDRTSPN